MLFFLFFLSFSTCVLEKASKGAKNAQKVMNLKIAGSYLNSVCTMRKASLDQGCSQLTLVKG